MLEIFGDVGQSKVHRFQVQVQLKISVHSALVSETRMWADAQRDGRPVEYICGASAKVQHSLYNATNFG